ncbi:ABC transporter ATP-binding protein [Kribbella sp. NBC_01245]|uniref:ABC transporter ATP-binding protein n=1 Tax=Kribbella sp. NBC_01245 TaxID=2903578 RepID=UPI002E2A4685|nr:ABC transporter ATP-binding protein [Kribbella sp. NBC_01245]
MTLLSVRDLRVGFDTVSGPVEAVRGISYDVQRGKILGIVGESGSGKTVSALSLLRLLPSNGKILGGSIGFDGVDLVTASERELRQIRGGRIGMVFQDPTTALNPVIRIGRQIDEAVLLHNRKLTRREIRRRTLETLDLVGVPDPARRAEQYPHQWSGGMRQRAVIAIALANDPDLVIADEPTTALDATVQAQVLQVLTDAREARGCAVVLITHDLGVISDIADDVVVMYAGEVAEACPASTLFSDSRHPYPRALMRSRPGWSSSVTRLVPIPGRPPDLASPLPGCPFQPRCDQAGDDPACATIDPPLIALTDRHRTACHHHDRLEVLG